MKRIVVCCDGTWNRPDQTTPTNVVKFALAIAPRDADGVEQRVHYFAGVGTRRGEILRGGVFGWGLSRAVRQGYMAVVDDYEPGDEIYLVGYSRGAYTARSVGGFLRNAGILRREHRDKLDEAYSLYRDRSKDSAPRARRAELFRRNYSHEGLEIAFMGVFDTVGSLGIPGSSLPIVKLFNRRWSFHDTRLSGTVKVACQALAIDEQRRTFEPTLWELPDPEPGQIFEQVWFAGCHGNVGGGSKDTGLPDLALGWIARAAARQGLAFIDGAFEPGRDLDVGEAIKVRFAPNPMGTINHSRTGFFRLWPPFLRPIGLKEHGNESLSSSAVARHAAKHNTEPQNLIDALARPHRVTDV